MKDLTLCQFLDMSLIEEIGISFNPRAEKLIYHRNRGYEICFSYSGVFTWELRDGRILRIRGNQLSLTPPEWEHRGALDRMNPGHLLFMVINPDQIDREFFRREERDFIRLKLEQNAGKICQAGPDLINNANYLDRLWKQVQTTLKDTSGSSEALLSLKSLMRQGIKLYLFQVLEAYSQSGQPAIPVQLQEILDYIERHLNEKITTGDLVSVSRHSHTRIFSLFKDFVGQSPNDYIQYKRCHRAASLLTETPLSVTHISYDLGYTSSQYFSQVFKKYMGFTPQSYRQQNNSSPCDILEAEEL